MLQKFLFLKMTQTESDDREDQKDLNEENNGNAF